ncbi:helix-turn-helix transcriptional regulator [Dankookia sp. GCM10030260]|uniref:helix-turn-helix transcriptional regulator n=1 Tax=Dankookia sp. GCM10030260 TaxID=3273390 RepID=UPI003619B89D
MYERSEDIVRLALLLQGSRSGLGLEDMQHEFGVSRRTAERMRDAVLRAFPQVEEVPTGEKVKRWRMPRGVLNQTVAFEARELEELTLSAERLRAEGLAERAVALDSLRAKIAALMPSASLARVEPDLEALLEAEGHAMRPGPRPGITDGLLETLRSALLGCRMVRLRYRRRITGRSTMVELEPHGILFGQQHYLVAFAAGTASRVPKLYALSNISDVTATGAQFARRPSFDLRAYAARAFGVFQEDPQEVKWRFAPALAIDALEHHFHPTQRKDLLDDGSLEVRFTAGGLQEMCWHLFTWGPGVEILAPEKLRTMYRKMLRAAEDTSPLSQSAPQGEEA